MWEDAKNENVVIPIQWALVFGVAGVLFFHLAYWMPALSFLILLYPACVLQLARVSSARKSFYFGLAAGLLTVGPQLHCFWVIFGPGAIALWLILSFWIAAFCGLANQCLKYFGVRWGSLLIPLIWTGLEYFRSELYYLRFSWLNIGYALPLPALSEVYRVFGMYGIGFIAMLLAVMCTFFLPRLRKPALKPISAALFALPFLCAFSKGISIGEAGPKSIRVCGIQMEFPAVPDVVLALDKALAAHPETDLFVLSEYTLDDTVPGSLKNWCRQHQRFLVVGGKDRAPGGNFYDTAFVIGPAGDVVFRQVKSVPIQFFKDGLPAPEQRLWESPWGRIGICICYDFSYTRVTDRLIKLGAQALIVPTMDVIDWGRHEHQLHALVAPVRAAEYGVPIFRVASSGISQLVLSNGQTAATAGFPGQGESLFGSLVLANAGTIPLDRWLAPVASAICALMVIYFAVRKFLPERANWLHRHSSLLLNT